MTRACEASRVSVTEWRERGSASVIAMGTGALLLSVGLACMGIGSAVVARHRAGSAADLGALAGAVHAMAGAEVACSEVEEIVAANGGRVASCTVDGLDVLVAVEVRPAGYAGRFGVARAVARAGPLSAPG
ncbi:Rv3654c family TadE-like protein [Longispora albida]|uniref:Rv3654c family TadE-like protein n=1 Tax=Longispora albida TaxID=203523 RepID=UPI00036E84E4|nr:Rv3654c family TadE-like protein [Longispora albida]